MQPPMATSECLLAKSKKEAIDFSEKSSRMTFYFLVKSLSDLTRIGYKSYEAIYLN